MRIKLFVMLISLLIISGCKDLEDAVDYGKHDVQFIQDATDDSTSDVNKQYTESF